MRLMKIFAITFAFLLASASPAFADIHPAEHVHTEQESPVNNSSVVTNVHTDTTSPTNTPMIMPPTATPEMVKKQAIQTRQVVEPTVEVSDTPTPQPTEVAATPTKAPIKKTSEGSKNPFVFVYNAVAYVVASLFGRL